jgi:hypothetical protein
MSVKMTKQHIFIIENNLQKAEVIFSLVPSDNRDTRSTCPTISMDLYLLILESTDLQQAAEINSTRNAKASDVNFH